MCLDHIICQYRSPRGSSIRTLLPGVLTLNIQSVEVIANLKGFQKSVCCGRDSRDKN